MKVYLDNCCFNRPFDDQTQEKVHIESESILAIIKKCNLLNYEILGSPALYLEIEKIPDTYKKQKVKLLYEQSITRTISYNQSILTRVKTLQNISAIKTLDAFHLAFAENAKADILLTTDLKLEKACSKLSLDIKVMNPINYFMEVFADDSNN